MLMVGNSPVWLSQEVPPIVGGVVGGEGEGGGAGEEVVHFLGLVGRGRASHFLDQDKYMEGHYGRSLN